MTLDELRANYEEWVEIKWSTKDAARALGISTDPMDFQRQNLTEFISMLGWITEVGEAGDVVKKHIAHDRDLDEVRAKLVEEMGDAMYYQTILCNRFAITLGEIMVNSMSKLDARYPNGFDKEIANQREL